MHVHFTCTHMCLYIHVHAESLEFCSLRVCGSQFVTATCTCTCMSYLLHTLLCNLLLRMIFLFYTVQDGASALYVASQNNCGKVVEVLLKHGAKTDAPRDVS